MKRMAATLASSLFFLALSSNNATASDEPSFSFGPAPANLSKTEGALSLGLNIVNVDIDNSDGLTATTLSISSKTSVKNNSSNKFTFYYLTIDSDLYDSGVGFGLEFSRSMGSPNGLAGIVGIRMDVQNYYLAGNTDWMIEVATYAFDLGVQNHSRISDSFMVIPWAKYSYVSGYSTISGCDPTCAPDEQVDLQYSALSFGMDAVFNDISLGAMYQSSQSSTVTSLSLSYDF